MKNMLRLFCLSLLIISVNAHATPAGNDPGSRLREGIDKMTLYLSRGQADPRQFQQFIEHEIAPYFDFDYMAKWAAGPRYRYLGNRERAAMTDTVRQLFLTSMAKLLADYSPNRVQYLPMRSNPQSGEVKLSLMAHPYKGYPTKVDFRLYRSQNGWKVFDVAANGQSAVVYYRKYFAQQARSAGSQQPYQQQRAYPGPRYGYR